MVDLEPHQNPVGANMAPRIDQVAQTCSVKFIVPRLPLCDPRNAKTLRNATWIGPSLGLCFSLFAPSTFGGTVVRAIRIFLVLRSSDLKRNY